MSPEVQYLVAPLILHRRILHLHRQYQLAIPSYGGAVWIADFVRVLSALFGLSTSAADELDSAEQARRKRILLTISAFCEFFKVGNTFH